MKNAWIMTVTILALAVGVEAAAPSKKSVPSGKMPQTVRVAALPDRSLIGTQVNVYLRPTSAYYFQSENLRPLLSNVLLLASPEDNEWGAATRQVTLALDEKELKRLRKAERKGRGEIIIQAVEPATDLSSAK